MGYLGFFIHSGFGDWSGPVKRFTTQEILIQTIVAHLAQLYSMSGHLRCTIFIQSEAIYRTSVTHLSSTLLSAYNKVAFNKKLAITKENLHTKYFHSPIMTLPLMKSHL